MPEVEQADAVSLKRASLRGALFAFLFSLSAFCAPRAQALDIPPTPQNHVYDDAGMLSEETRSKLNSALYRFDQATSNQVLVAIFPSLENESLEDFSIRLAQAWKPGQKGRDNGVILLIFKQERQLRIEVGYGLEGALTDAKSGLIIQQVIVPRFKAGDFDGGVTAGVSAILQTIQGEFQSVRQNGEGYRTLSPQEAEALRRQGMAAAVVILFSIFGLFIIDVLRYKTYSHEHRIYNDRYTFWEWFFRFAILLAVLSFIFRMIFYILLSSRGGSGGRGGGFSSGGGSFGGGGASGRW